MEFDKAKVKGYWLRASDLADLYRVKPATIYSWVKEDDDNRDVGLDKIVKLPEPEIRNFGRSMVWDRNTVRDHMRSRGLDVPARINTLGLPKPRIEDGDRTLFIEDMMAKFGYTVRPEFQARISQGLFPQPDFCYGRPWPSIWLESSVDAWIEARKPVTTYSRINPPSPDGLTAYDVFHGGEFVGSTEKYVLRVDAVRDGRAIKDKPVYRWRSRDADGGVVGNDLFPARKRAAFALVPKEERRKPMNKEE